jgi:hypothetical protein
MPQNRTPQFEALPPLIIPKSRARENRGKAVHPKSRSSNIVTEDLRSSPDSLARGGNKRYTLRSTKNSQSSTPLPVHVTIAYVESRKSSLRRPRSDSAVGDNLSFMGIKKKVKRVHLL